jgi:hypothetical protein
VKMVRRFTAWLASLVHYFGRCDVNEPTDSRIDSFHEPIPTCSLRQYDPQHKVYVYLMTFQVTGRNF